MLTARNFVSRFISAVLCGIMFGRYIQHTYVDWSHRGREAFLANQASRFDKWMNPPHSAWATVIGGTVVVLCVVAFYELISFGISKIFKPESSA